jgi:hypothetical protein
LQQFCQYKTWWKRAKLEINLTQRHHTARRPGCGGEDWDGKLIFCVSEALLVGFWRNLLDTSILLASVRKRAQPVETRHRAEYQSVNE